MKDEYDLSDAKRAPYAKKFKQQITINISIEATEYFKELAKETGIPYQTLINYYLLDCVKHKRRPSFDWK